MNTYEQQRFDCLYQQYLTNLTLQGKRPATIDAYSRAGSPDKLTTVGLKRYFADLIASDSWSTVKLDRNGLQFFYRHLINQSWQWLNIVKPPQVNHLPDIDSPLMQVHIRDAKGGKGYFLLLQKWHTSHPCE